MSKSVWRAASFSAASPPPLSSCDLTNFALKRRRGRLRLRLFLRLQLTCCGPSLRSFLVALAAGAEPYAAKCSPRPGAGGCPGLLLPSRRGRGRRRSPCSLAPGRLPCRGSIRQAWRGPTCDGGRLGFLAATWPTWASCLAVCVQSRHARSASSHHVFPPSAPATLSLPTGASAAPLTHRLASFTHARFLPGYFARHSPTAD